MITRCLSLAMLLLCAGCTASDAYVRSTALERAAFDLDCPKEQLTATPLGDTVVMGRTPASPGVERTVLGVSGCDTKGVYVVECAPSGFRTSCNALLNADVERADSTPGGDDSRE